MEAAMWGAGLIIGFTIARLTAKDPSDIAEGAKLFGIVFISLFLILIVSLIYIRIP